MLLIVLLYFICASMFTISKWGLAYAEPFFFMAVRMIIAGLMLGAFALYKELQKGSYQFWSNCKQVLQDWCLFAQIVTFHIYLTYICDLCALKQISSIESAFLYNLSPFIAALFSYFWFAESMTAKKWVGLALGFASLLPEFFHAGFGNLFSASIPRLITLIAVISSAYGWIVVRALVKKGYSPLFINSFGMFFGGLIALLTSYYTEPWSPYPVKEFIPFVWAIIMIVVVSNILFYNLYGYLLKKYTATFLSFAGFICPFFAALLGHIFLAESISPYLMLSFALVCIGLYVFYREEMRQGYILEK